ncbi:putative methyltransferase-domain-containing protein [Lophiotrema nucula]|uniref:Putative methyltransferase-domain-containing protein n=1 Tax=Lophiotrema nucula TaxID=690887 RepID=A0A6A5Z2V4_9PLEO|nr:putative methyltransferase-domain-containing protein [Lophiotrema nucula]
MNTSTESSLTILRRQYLQLLEPQYMRWPDSTTLKAPTIQTWIFDNLFDAEQIAHPPPDRYRLRVLKMLIAKLEDAVNDPEDDEISDELMSTLALLLSSSLPSELASIQQKAYVTYSYSHFADDQSSGELPVTLLESRSVISSSGTTGLRTWEAALLLGAYLASSHGRQFVQNKRVFEVGAGTGMLSILCAKHLGASGVVATDGDEAVVDAINTNIFLNEHDSGESNRTVVHTAAVKWGYPIEASTFAEDYGMDVPDVVLGADVTYDKAVIPSLVSTLTEFFGLNSALQVLVAATIRNEQTFETFLNACRRNRFDLELVEFPLLPEHLQTGPFYPTSTPIQIWRITRPQPPVDLFAF